MAVHELHEKNISITIFSELGELYKNIHKELNKNLKKTYAQNQKFLMAQRSQERAKLQSLDMKTIKLSEKPQCEISTTDSIDPSTKLINLKTKHLKQSSIFFCKTQRMKTVIGLPIMYTICHPKYVTEQTHDKKKK